MRSTLVGRVTACLPRIFELVYQAESRLAQWHARDAMSTRQSINFGPSVSA